jgi:hypothetical protein
VTDIKRFFRHRYILSICLFIGERKSTLFRSLYLFARCAGGKNAFRPYFIGVKRTCRLILGGLWVALCG